MATGNQDLGVTLSSQGRSGALRAEPVSQSQAEPPAANAIADILDRAADLIEPEGAWTQGAYGIGGAHCVLGALAAVAGVDPEEAWVGHLADEARFPLAEVTGSKACYLSDWNDAPERTQAEVVAKLREAAAKAREQVTA